MNNAQRPAAQSLLAGLNSAQLKAVQFTPHAPIQILAGPGSGKTRVLTSRIAYMILQHSISPSSICAVTFTNKAANEMRQRLKKLIGPGRTELLKMGTFHALCARFLRIHSSLVGLDANFTICDADESRKIIAAILKKHKDYLEERRIVLTENGAQSIISKAKAKGQTPNEVLRKAGVTRIRSVNAPPDSNDAPRHNQLEYVVGITYEEYELTLRRNNSLDFDDLLLYGVKLFRGFKQTVSWCKYVLVDEFQDTNTTQYSLMVALAIHKCVTVVGDPDQSIYGWRSAEVENLAKMCRDFDGAQQILLEQNYRSTASILKASLAIVSQDKNRIPKSLHTSHPSGSTPFLHCFSTEHAEALFIAVEIKRIISHMGGALSWGDVAILLRFNALSRTIEGELQKHGIPSRVLGGHKFFERQEVKNILAYLQLIDNPDFNPALVRACHVPSRGIGEKTLQEITARAEKSKVSQLSIMESICDGRSPDMKPAVKRKLSSFVSVIRKLRDLANKGTSPADLIRRLVDLVGFEDHLKKTQPDWEGRWENVKELITFATEIATNITAVAEQTVTNEDPEETPLRSFLQATMLSSEGDNQNEEESKDKVTISTCHAAKGLEWPIVIIPSAEDGTFPFARSEDEDEERRLLYVACTRAQGLLYLSYTASRSIAGNRMNRVMTPFVSIVQWDDPTIFMDLQPTFSPGDRKVICDILNRPLPSESDVAERVAEFERTTSHHLMDDFIQLSETPFSNAPVNLADLTTTFTSSSTVLRTTSGTVSSTSSKPTSFRQSCPPGDPSRLANGLCGMVTQPVQESPWEDAFASTRSLSGQTVANFRPQTSSSPLGSANAAARYTESISRPALRPTSDNSSSRILPRVSDPSVTSKSSASWPSRSVQEQAVSSRPKISVTKEYTLPAKLQLHRLLCATDSRSSSPHRHENVMPAQALIVASPPNPGSTAGAPPLKTYAAPQSTKRRLGMGRGTGGYANKKFKPPGS
ncbi:hypothetical protein H2248_008432 [Termitomyces sp. 'cryptogamus']|nr:hypothetical protein H2248_008432 [Termitomyces sp. 'cryptogamus']